MDLLEVFFRGNSYGHVRTQAAPTGRESPIIRLENAGLWQMAQLYVDARSEPQTHLPPHCDLNLARWIYLYGVDQFGEKEFSRAAARLWVWHEGMDNETQS